MDTETPKQIAERIASPAIGKVKPAVWQSMVDDIESAITNAVAAERERCAMIVNDARGTNFDLRGIVVAIRQGDPS